MATLSELYAVHGESGQYACDEIPAVILYWDNEKDEFWGKPMSGGCVSVKANTWLSIFLCSQTVRVYEPEVEKESCTKAIETIEGRLTTIESWLKTIAQTQNVHKGQIQKLREESEEGYDLLKKRIIDLERAAVKPQAKPVRAKSVPTVGVYDGGRKKTKSKLKSAKPIPPEMRHIKEGGW
jgi:hypothetical protein